MSGPSRRSGSLRWGLFLTLIVLGTSGFLAQPGQAQDGTLIDTNAMDIPPNVAIKVGEDTVSRDEFRGRLERRFNKVKRSRQLPDTADLQKVREAAKETIRRQIVNRMVVRYHALRSGMDAPDTLVEKAFQASIEEAGSREKFEKQLAERGSSVEEHRDRIRRKILMRLYLEENVEEPEISDTEIKRVYDANKGRISQSYEEIKPRLRQMIRKKKYERATARLVRELKRKTEIKVNLQDL